MLTFILSSEEVAFHWS